jgi:hypothetical protein
VAKQAEIDHQNTLRENKNELYAILVRPIFWLGTFHTASRCSQPPAAPMRNFHMTSKPLLQIKLASASGGWSCSR